MDAVLASTGPELPAASITEPAATAPMTVPLGGVAPPDTVTVYGPLPDPVTPVTLHPVDVPVNEKSPDASPVTASLKLTE